MNRFLEKHAIIVNQINVVGETKNGEYIIGYILYKRQPIESDFNNGTSKKGSFNRFSPGIKLHLLIDEADRIILNAIKELFPSTHLKSFPIFGDYAKSRYEHILKRPSEIAVINVFPDISEINPRLTPIKSVGFSKNINIYQKYSLESIKDHYFNGLCNFDRCEEIIDQLNQFEFL